MKTYNGHCRECGTAYTALSARKKFCSVKCEKTFNNRRMTRGAMFYDLFMASRYQRDVADEAGLRSVMARMAMRFREEDERERESRRSWLPVADTMEKITVVDRAVGNSIEGQMKIGRRVSA